METSLGNIGDFNVSMHNPVENEASIGEGVTNTMSDPASGPRAGPASEQPCPPPRMKPLTPLQSEMEHLLDRVNTLPDKFGKLLEDTIQEMNELVQRIQDRVAEVGEAAIMTLGDKTEMSARVFEGEMGGAKACDEEVRELQTKLVDLTRKAAFLTYMDE